MSMSTITSMLKTLPQVNHRLEVKKVANDVLLIDDAYNSNPQGFKSAIDLLATLKTTRNILITPGMVELGKKHDEEHYKIGKYAGEKVEAVYGCCRMVLEWIGLCGQISVSCPVLSCLWMV